MTLNLTKCLFSTDSLQWFFTNEGNKADEKMQKIVEVFWVFRNMLNNLHKIIVHLEILTHL